MVRYGIIGSGMMGHEHIRNIALLDDTIVTVVADPDEGMRESAATLCEQQFKTRPKTFDSFEPLLSKEICDALVIVSPNHTHHAIMQEAMKCGLPILCEKPIGVTEAECLEMLQWQKEYNTPVWVAMEYRYMPPMVRLTQDVISGRIGKLVQLSIREHRFPFLEKVGDWNRFNINTGGTLVEKCCHFFDLMRLITQSMPVRLYASGAMDVNFLDEDYDGETPNILDNAFVIVDFENGTRAMLDLSMFDEASSWQEIVSATGSKASMSARIPGPARFSLDGKERLSEVCFADRETKLETCEPVEVDHTILSAGDHHGSTYYQHLKFRNMVQNGGDAEVTLLDGALAVAIGAAAEESARLGVSIDLRERLMAYLN